MSNCLYNRNTPKRASSDKPHLLLWRCAMRESIARDLSCLIRQGLKFKLIIMRDVCVRPPWPVIVQILICRVVCICGINVSACCTALKPTGILTRYLFDVTMTIS